MKDEVELNAAPGFLEPHVADEFPGLRLDWLTIKGHPSASPPEVVARLRALSSRYRGATVVAMRTQPIPHAYRVFYRQIGLDPDSSRIPSEQAAVDRLMRGHFRSRNLIDDALLIALVETGVPVWAVNADRVDESGLGIRTAVAGDRLGSGEYANYVHPGTLVVADRSHVHAILFGDVAPDHAADRDTTRLVLFAVAVAGVPEIHVEEAMWIALEVIGTHR